MLSVNAHPTWSYGINSVNKSRKSVSASVEYVSDTSVEGWWSLLTLRKLKFFGLLAEIAGVKLDHYSDIGAFSRFVNTLQESPSCKQESIRKLMSQQDYIIRKNRFRIMDAEVMKVRRIRSCKLRRKNLRPVIEQILLQIPNSFLPEVVIMFIVRELLGLDEFTGCADCKRNKRPLDTIISHNTEMCKFTNCELRCSRCVRYNNVYTFHSTTLCTYKPSDTDWHSTNSFSYCPSYRRYEDSNHDSDSDSDF